MNLGCLVVATTVVGIIIGSPLNTGQSHHPTTGRARGKDSPQGEQAPLRSEEVSRTSPQNSRAMELFPWSLALPVASRARMSCFTLFFCLPLELFKLNPKSRRSIGTRRISSMNHTTVNAVVHVPVAKTQLHRIP